MYTRVGRLQTPSQVHKSFANFPSGKVFFSKKDILIKPGPAFGAVARVGAK